MIPMNIEFSQDQVVHIRALDGSCEPFEARLLAFAGRHLSVTTPVKLARGAPLRIEWMHHLILAEVVGESVGEVYDLLIRHALDQRDIESFRKIWH